MKDQVLWIVIGAIVVATILMFTMSARAGEREAERNVGAVAEPPATDEVFDVEPAQDGEPVVAVLSTVEDAQALHAQLEAAAPAAGWALPASAPTLIDDWQPVRAGHATLSVPPDWTELNRIGEADADDQTVGMGSPAQDLYVELRHIRNADNNYMTTLAEHAVSEYSRSPDRLREGVIHGHAPRTQHLAAGHLEIMDQFGKAVDEDGAPTFRLVLWRGRWRRGEEFDRVEFTATMAQDRYEEFAPLVNRILETVEIGE